MRGPHPLRILAVGLLLLAIAALLQMMFSFSLGRSVEWVLVALLALSFFADIGVYVIFLLFAFWTMRSTMMIFPELFLLGALCLAAYGFQKLLPKTQWFAAGVAGFFAVIFFYAAVLGGTVLSLVVPLLLIALGTGLAAALLTGTLSLWYMPRR